MRFKKHKIHLAHFYVFADSTCLFILVCLAAHSLLRPLDARHRREASTFRIDPLVYTVIIREPGPVAS